MHKYQKNKDINLKLWDTCIHNSINGNIYALSWYLNIVAFEWDAIIQEEDGHYISVMPLPFEIKSGLKCLKHPLFTHQLGLFFLENYNATSQDYAQIFEIINKEFGSVTKYNLNIHNLIDHNIAGFNLEPKHSYQIDLSGSYHKKLEIYKEKKNSLAQAKNTNLKIIPSLNINKLILMFNENLSQKNLDIKNNHESYDILKNIYLEASSRRFSRIYEVANRQKETIALALFLIYKRDLIYFISAFNPEEGRKPGFTLLLEFILKNYSEMDYLLKFEESPGNYAEEFILRLGAEKKEYFSISK